MEHFIIRLTELLQRKERFTYDLRGDCQVYNGVVAAYRATQDSDHFIDLPMVIAHALAHDGIVGGWKNPADGRTYYDSCRLFTDVQEAVRFADREGQQAVYNLNREEEVAVRQNLNAA
jgi:fructokinase